MFLIDSIITGVIVKDLKRIGILALRIIQIVKWPRYQKAMMGISGPCLIPNNLFIVISWDKSLQYYNIGEHVLIPVKYQPVCHDTNGEEY